MAVRIKWKRSTLNRAVRYFLPVAAAYGPCDRRKNWADPLSGTKTVIFE